MATHLSAVWYVEAGHLPDDPRATMGSAVAVRVCCPSRERYQTLLLTTAHVVRGRADDQDLEGWGAVCPVIDAFPAGSTYPCVRRRVRPWLHGPTLAGPVDEASRTPANDWILLELLDDAEQAVAADQVATAPLADGFRGWAEIVGFPGGGARLKQSTIVRPARISTFFAADEHSGLLLLDGFPLRGGMSGGGVFDTAGRLMGIHRASREAVLQTEAVHLGEIHARIEERGWSLVSVRDEGQPLRACVVWTYVETEDDARRAHRLRDRVERIADVTGVRIVWVPWNTETFGMATRSSDTAGDVVHLLVAIVDRPDNEISASTHRARLQLLNHVRDGTALSYLYVGPNAGYRVDRTFPWRHFLTDDALNAEAARDLTLWLTDARAKRQQVDSTRGSLHSTRAEPSRLVRLLHELFELEDVLTTTELELLEEAAQRLLNADRSEASAQSDSANVTDWLLQRSRDDSPLHERQRLQSGLRAELIAALLRLALLLDSLRPLQTDSEPVATADGVLHFVHELRLSRGGYVRFVLAVPSRVFAEPVRLCTSVRVEHFWQRHRHIFLAARWVIAVEPSELKLMEDPHVPDGVLEELQARGEAYKHIEVSIGHYGDDELPALRQLRPHPDTAVRADVVFWSDAEPLTLRVRTGEHDTFQAHIPPGEMATLPLDVLRIGRSYSWSLTTRSGMSRGNGRIERLHTDDVALAVAASQLELDDRLVLLQRLRLEDDLMCEVWPTLDGDTAAPGRYRTLLHSLTNALSYLLEHCPRSAMIASYRTAARWVADRANGGLP